MLPDILLSYLIPPYFFHYVIHLCVAHMFVTHLFQCFKVIIYFLYGAICNKKKRSRALYNRYNNVNKYLQPGYGKNICKDK